jgi:hypothetical protein
MDVIVRESGDGDARSVEIGGGSVIEAICISGQRLRSVAVPLLELRAAENR